MTRIILSITLISIIATSSVKSHVVEQLFLSLEKADSTLELDVTFDAAYALPELRNDPNSTQPKRAWLLSRSKLQHENLRQGAERYIRESIQFNFEGSNIPYQVSFPDYLTTPPSFPSLLNEGAYFTMRITGELPEDIPGEITATILAGDRPDFIIAVRQADRTNHIVLEPETSATLYSISLSGEVKTSEPSLVNIFWLGFRHVIPDGLDHVLFILGLFLMVRKWQSIISQSLVFTLAHSISLGLAVSGLINIQQWSGSWLIEPLIALSLTAIAVENILLKNTGKRRMITVFIFGIIHGLGFAGSLSSVLHKDTNWVITLATANIGVEVAQLALLTLAWGLTLKWWETKIYTYFRILASILIAATGLWWTINRLFT